MAEMFKMKHQVKYYEADVTGKLSLPMIFNLAVLSSTMQSIELNVGPDFTHAQGLGWIILQEVLTIKRRPNDGEEIILQTLAREFNPYFAKRLYQITDLDGNVLVNIEALYAMVDMEKRKMARIPQEMVDAYQSERVKKITRDVEPAKFAEDDQANRVQKYAVRFLDIDSNRHVNNSKYADWMQDVLDPAYVLEHEPVAMNIKFEQEVRLGDMVQSEVKFANDNQTIHRIVSGDQVSAEAEITWQKI